ncbi:MAG: ribosome-binding factor A [Candidatus Abawacabacteria bacterium RIFCSPHIGHO2_01_FULL_46_8]|uniref:Ribosome-binding factor A n=1 Tax=Candidatus Abawacabacteria bacterium RIFCSPHIGHO2_01_FULL_46_8 TaxID=1817815 RepID=A0A1F4XIE3_9BACT|nr:MAG: ribosome-binding factor A [Candidatus Abawacabacteria bacterium RIFCSPHIGHO2_01_FULL_46_8]
MSKRLERASSFLHQEVSRILPTFIHDKRLGLLTVSKVDLAADLGRALVWISVLGNEFPLETVESLLNKQAKGLQTTIAKSLAWKRTPKISFRIDHSGDYAQHIEQVLSGLEG